MSTTFPRVRNSRRGYRIDEVELFLEEARTAYSAPVGSPAMLDAASIRLIAFTMEKGGYSPTHVDAALERLEDAFATRERDRVFANPGGDTAWYGKARSTAQVVLDRLDRPDGNKFKRVGLLSAGYSKKDVDRFGERLVQYFQHGKSMSVDEVRTVTFRPAKGGYNEAQVDLLLDTVIDVMLAVR